MNSIFDGLDDGTDSWDDAYGWGDAEDWDGYEELMPDADGNYTIYSEGRAQFAVITLMDGQEFSFGSEDYLVSNPVSYTHLDGHTGWHTIFLY